MKDDNNSYSDSYTKVHMKRDIHELAKQRAKAQNRTIANYIAHLVQQEANQATKKTSSGVNMKVK